MSAGLRRFLGLVLGLVALLLVASALPPLAFELLLRLPFGWIAFLQRVLPQVTPNASALGFGLLCSILIVTGVHWLATGFHRRQAGAHPDGTPWRWTWSIALYAMLWCLFLAAMGVTGLAHQTAWLIHSREPVRVLQSPNADFGELLVEQSELRRAAEEAAWRAEAVRERYLAGRNERLALRHPQAEHLEQWQTVFVADRKGTLAGAFLFHRDPARRQKTGFVVVSPTSTAGLQPGPTLPELLRQCTEQAQGNSAGGAAGARAVP